MNRLSSISMSTVVILLFWLIQAGCDTGTDLDLPDHAVAVNEGGSILVSAGVYDLKQTPFYVVWDAGSVPTCMEGSGVVTSVQHEETADGRTVLWISAQVPAGETRVYVPSQRTDCGDSTFQWERLGDDRSRLLIDGIPVIEYIYPVFDRERDEETMKPFHHVYAPDGSRLITKGAGGRYSHHRGIFYGYSNVRIGEEGDRMNMWSAGADRGEVTEHVSFLREWTGPVFGGHETAIEWKDPGGNVFADEIRKVTVYRRPDGELLVDVQSDLTSRVDELRLGGDLHHAGLQFRAAQYVADNPENSRYLRPEAWADHPTDEEFNDPENYINQPWNAFQFVIEGEPYTVGYFSHPRNPDGGEMSERLYGRFGEYIPGNVLDEGETLTLRYRLLITSGHQIDRERMQQEYSAYAGS